MRRPSASSRGSEPPARLASPGGPGLQLRLEAQIPVIMMGETGCGKTSLVRFAVVKIEKKVRERERERERERGGQGERVRETGREIT